MIKAKLTPVGKILVFLIAAVVILTPLYYFGAFKWLDSKATKKDSGAPVATNNVPDPSANKKDVMDISLDEWIGWKPIIDANGGLKTASGSTFDKLGLKVNINIIDDATQSSNALIKGSLDAAGYTVNRLAFLYPKFKDANVQVEMPYITNSSTGGDGIIAKKEINSVNDLVGKKIGVPRYSEAQTLVMWLLQKSDLSKEQIDQIKKNMVMFDTPDDAAKAFFAGQLDAAATWQPYLSQAKESTGGHILFDTKAAKNIVIDGIVFRKDYADANKDKIAKFIEGSLKASEMYTTQFTAIKDSMPLFATETDDSIKSMTGDATLADYATNKELLNSTSKTLYTDMSNVWTNLGEKAVPGDVDKIFDASILATLADKFPSTATQKPTFTQSDRDTAQKQDNNEALLKKNVTINFTSDSDAFTDQAAAYNAMNQFISIAKIMNGTVIQIEGNTNGNGDPQFLKDLSYKRAKAVATYLQFQGIDPSRLVIVGNGSSKPIAPNTPENEAKNMRTDLFFKVVGK